MTDKQKREMNTVTIGAMIVVFIAMIVCLKIPQKAIGKIKSLSNKEVTVYEDQRSINGIAILMKCGLICVNEQVRSSVF